MRILKILLLLTALSLAPAHAVEHSWSDASKEAVGTAFGQGSSKVWFTVAHGVLTEVYYPTVDHAQVGDSQLLFIDHGRFLEEKRDFAHTIGHPTAPPSPRPIIEARSVDDLIRFTKEIITDPARNVLRAHYHFDVLPEGVEIYVLHKPTADNDGAGDHGKIVRNQMTGQAAFVDWDIAAHDGPLAVQAVLTSAPVLKASVGIVGDTDGWQDLHRNGRLTQEIGENEGNLAYVAQLTPRSELDVAIGFGGSAPEALSQAAASLEVDFASARSAYDDGWQGYALALSQAPWLSAVPPALRANLLWDALIVKAHEDKLNPGAIVASLSIPNIPAGVGSPDGKGTGGYHLIWPRDLFKSGLALLRLGDVGTALNVLRFMSRMEHDGKMAQNAWVDGRSFWTAQQMDEEAFPILLADELVRAGVTLDPALREFVARRIAVVQNSNGLTGQERWEEAAGYSPNSIAVMAAALSRVGDAAGAQRLLDIALAKTISRQGPLSSLPYFVRISRNGDSDTGATIRIANGGPELPEYRVLDGGFQEWLRWFPHPERGFGAAGAALSTFVHNTLPVYDDPNNGVALYANGIPFYRRYTSDNYGVGHVGGPWPILTLERALPAMVTNPGVGYTYLAQVLTMFGPGELCPEQLDENLRPMPYAASPLVWCHAEMIELAHRTAVGVVGLPTDF